MRGVHECLDAVMAALMVILGCGPLIMVACVLVYNWSGIQMFGWIAGATMLTLLATVCLAGPLAVIQTILDACD